VGAIQVNVDNFVRAETDRMFRDLAAVAGGVNRWNHSRHPTAVDEQTVIRMNRDTLYSFAVVDISDGATLTIPDAGDRYLSVMVVNQDHFVNAVLHDAGTHALTVDEHQTRHVVLAARVLVDATDPDDLAAVHAIQDGLALDAASSQPFEMPDYDTESFDAARSALLALAALPTPVRGTFGRRSEVDPIHHLLGTAFGWGGLPEEEAVYVNVEPDLPVGSYRIEVGEVPVDAFWSISVYNADGYFEVNPMGTYSVNSVTAKRNADGTVTVHLGPGTSDLPNFVPITDGWNYIVRLYRPRPEVRDGSFVFPGVVPEAG
jgi:hypothetical protein